MRTSGILMPVFSLPSKYGIGCFSKEAYQFVDFLKESGQKNWQVLPLGQTSYGDSPHLHKKSRKHLFIKGFSSFFVLSGTNSVLLFFWCI